MSSKHPLDLLVRNLELRTPLSRDAREAVLALPHTVRTIEHSTYIVREGEPPTKCGVLVSGFAYRQKITGEGARQIIAIHMPGDAVDFQNLYLDVSDHNVQMLTRGDVAFVDRSEFKELARSNSEIGNALFVSTLVEASIFREWVVNVGRRQARQRIAHVLCELGSRLDALGLAPKVGYDLPVHVSRTLKELAAEGLIVRNRRSVSFPSWQAIREAGDFNERYLHLEPQISAQ